MGRVSPASAHCEFFMEHDNPTDRRVEFLLWQQYYWLEYIAKILLWIWILIFAYILSDVITTMLEKD